MRDCRDSSFVGLRQNAGIYKPIADEAEITNPPTPDIDVVCSFDSGFVIERGLVVEG